MVDRSRRDRVLSTKILKEIDEIGKFIEGVSEKNFYADKKTQKAVVMSLIIIGELTKNYSDDFLEANKHVPWKKIQAFRNIAAHRYEIIDMEIVWDTIQISIADLKKELTVINL